MAPIFKPGDEKIFRSTGEPRFPRLVNFIYLVLSLGAMALGVLALLVGQMVAGIILMLAGSGISVAILYHEVSETLMVRRMRLRQTKDSLPPELEDTTGDERKA